jgi:hypothetical protein
MVISMVIFIECPPKTNVRQVVGRLVKVEAWGCPDFHTGAESNSSLLYSFPTFYVCTSDKKDKSGLLGRHLKYKSILKAVVCISGTMIEFGGKRVEENIYLINAPADMKKRGSTHRAVSFLLSLPSSLQQKRYFIRESRVERENKRGEGVRWNHYQKMCGCGWWPLPLVVLLCIEMCVHGALI